MRRPPGRRNAGVRAKPCYIRARHGRRECAPAFPRDRRTRRKGREWPRQLVLALFVYRVRVLVVSVKKLSGQRGWRQIVEDILGRTHCHESTVVTGV